VRKGSVAIAPRAACGTFFSLKNPQSLSCSFGIANRRNRRNRFADFATSLAATVAQSGVETKRINFRALVSTCFLCKMAFVSSFHA
jgi:hypothetical protein